MSDRTTDTEEELMTGNRWGTQRTATAAWRKLRAQVLDRDGHRCQIRGTACIGQAETVDHIVPVFRGGRDDASNLRAACWPCHRSLTGRQARDAQGYRKRPPEDHPGLL